jgi:hypothetical protein
MAEINPKSRCRIPLPRREDLDANGQKIFDYFTSGSKGVLRGPTVPLVFGCMSLRWPKCMSLSATISDSMLESESWSQESEQGDKWSFCLTAG